MVQVRWANTNEQELGAEEERDVVRGQEVGGGGTMV
jgi:hypothetical protein